MKFDSAHRFAAALTLCSLCALLAACDRGANDSRTAGQKLDSAVAQTEKTLEGLKGEARTAGQELKQAASTLSEKIDRSAGDAGITARVKTALAKDDELNALKIDVDTAAGRVSLGGTAPTTAAKQRATTIAQAVEGVVAVDNRLVVPAAAAVRN